jgi:hypothetical protein
VTLTGLDRGGGVAVPDLLGGSRIAAAELGYSGDIAVAVLKQLRRIPASVLTNGELVAMAMLDDPRMVLFAFLKDVAALTAPVLHDRSPMAFSILLDPRAVPGIRASHAGKNCDKAHRHNHRFHVIVSCPKSASSALLVWGYRSGTVN